MPKFIIKIGHDDKELINNQDICCYIVSKDSAPDVFEKAKNSDKLVLTEDMDFCEGKALDGVIINHQIDEKFPKYMKTLQKKTAKKFLGIVCPLRRHEAMIASEAEPDFVIFDTKDSLSEEECNVLQWYAELFLIQSAIIYNPKVDENLLNIADFVILNTSEYKILVDKIKTLD